MAKLTYIKGDATKPNTDAYVLICHVVNDIGRWGSGFVNAVTARWGEGVRDMYMAWADKNPENHYKNLVVTMNAFHESPHRIRLGGIQICPTGNDMIAVVNMVGQHKTNDTSDDPTRPPIRYGALVEAMNRVAGWASDNCEDEGPIEIHCPKFGSDLAGGHWETIEAMIQELWVDRGIDVVVYEFDG